MPFNDNQFPVATLPQDGLPTGVQGMHGRGVPALVQNLPASQALNALRGRWLGGNRQARRNPPTEQRQGRGGRPPVFTPDARPIQENTARAAHAHRQGRPTRSQQRGQGVPNFFNVPYNGRGVR